LGKIEERKRDSGLKTSKNYWKSNQVTKST